MSTHEHSKNVKPQVSNVAEMAKFQGRLRCAWLVWIGYRSIVFPVLLATLLSTQPNMIGGIAWQIVWLVPAFLFTPWVIKGKSPYALLLGSMVTLLYLGASGVTLFSRFYDNGISLWWVYLLDTILLALINIWLFKLLKVLPSMNKSH